MAAFTTVMASSPAATSQAGTHMANITQAAMPGMAMSSSTKK